VHVLTGEKEKNISVCELCAECRASAVLKGKPRFDDVKHKLKLLERNAALCENLEDRAEKDLALY